MNQKGGVGKTTLTQALARCLNRKGYKVLLVDMDAQRNLTFLVTGREDFKSGVGTFIITPKAQDSVVRVDERLSIIPGSESLYLKKIPIKALRDSLAAVKDSFDFCLIDTPPIVSQTSVSCAIAADFVLVPCLADLLSVKAFTATLESVQSAKKINPNVKALGALLTRFTPRMRVSKGVVEALTILCAQHHTRLLEAKVTESNVFRQAQIQRKSIFDFLPGRATQDIEAVTAELLTLIGE